MERKRILLVIPNLGPGGAQQVFRNQLRCFGKDYEVYGCVFNWSDSFESDRLDNIISLEVDAGRCWIGKSVALLRRIRKLRNLKKSLRIQVAISHLEGADYVNCGSKVGEKTIAWIHGTKVNDQNIAGLLGWLRLHVLLPYCYSRIDRLVGVSKGIASELRHYFNIDGNRIATIPNGLPISELMRKSELPATNIFDHLVKNHFVLITHCRLAFQKNLSSMISIFADVRMNRDTKLVVLGDGELREQLIREAAGKGLKVYSSFEQRNGSELGSDIYFLGHQSNVYPFLRKASLYLMTSAWEGFPLALCEALALGLTVVAADCPTGPREILCPQLPEQAMSSVPIESIGGWLMPPAIGDQALKVWSVKISELIDHPEALQQKSANAPQLVQDLDMNAVQKKWIQLLE
ncbi:MAG: glycosyltransferase [Bacteroidetes bacterium]|nr:glycosyltransferase [Bacteroidota bacterium]